MVKLAIDIPYSLGPDADEFHHSYLATGRAFVAAALRDEVLSKASRASMRRGKSIGGGGFPVPRERKSASMHVTTIACKRGQDPSATFFTTDSVRARRPVSLGAGRCLGRVLPTGVSDENLYRVSR